MALTYSYDAANDSDFLTNGKYPARLTRIIDLGTQQVSYSNKPGEVFNTPQVLFEFEVFTPSGKALTANRQFNVSLSAKAVLRQFLEKWRGKNYTPEQLDKFDISALLGMTGLMTIVINTSTTGKTYTNIDSIRYVKGLNVPPSPNTPMILDFDKPDKAIFDSLPQWIQNKILGANNCPVVFSGVTTTADEWFASPATGNSNTEDDDDIPF